MININKKNGESLLTENIIFVILNIVFLVILVVFLYIKMDSPAVFEEKYAKELALMIDAAKPGMLIYFDIDESNGDEAWFKYHFSEAVKIQDNLITVKLREKGGYSYSFFSKNAVSEVDSKGRVAILVR
ncbi:MAG: hypothetical protein AABW50_03555 [Nanoarchaeota archaeon]